MTNDEQIAASLAAYARRAKRIDELDAVHQPPRDCCASCASSEYRKLIARQARAAVILVAKLRRRGAPGDADIVTRIRAEYPEET